MAALIDTYLGGIKRVHGECRASQERTHNKDTPTLAPRERRTQLSSRSLSLLLLLLLLLYLSITPL